MSFLKELKSWIGLDPDSTTRKEDVSENKPLFVYVKIPANLGPVDRGEMFEDPLQRALESGAIGTITGGGSQLGEMDEAGHREIEFCDIDLELYDAVKGLEVLRHELARLQAPPGTIMTYELEGREWEDPVYPPKPS